MNFLLQTSSKTDTNTEIHRTENSQGISKLKKDASEGGEIADVARRKLEKRLGRTVVSKNNFLPTRHKKKLLNK